MPPEHLHGVDALAAGSSFAISAARISRRADALCRRGRLAGRVGQTRSLRPVALLDLGADHHARVQIHAILQLSSQRFRLPFNEADVGQAPRLARLGSPADHRLVERDVLAQRLDSSTILFLVDSRRATAPHAHVPRHKEDERFGDVVCEDARERDVLWSSCSASTCTASSSSSS